MDRLGYKPRSETKHRKTYPTLAASYTSAARRSTAAIGEAKKQNQVDKMST